MKEQPAVSIIMPVYNRARFLPEAFASICSQRFKDWELIVVDDGSTDESSRIIDEQSKFITQPIRVIYQSNAGAYGARNTGLDLAIGRAIAFYDSDDLWLPHHLADCMEALEDNPDVDWVYGSCRIVDEASGSILADSTFYCDGKPREFLTLKRRSSGNLQVIDDPAAIQCMVTHGGFNGLQNSVIRAHLFQNKRFEALKRNEAEDQLFVLRALRAGSRIGYIDNVHVVYRVHDSNSSAAGSDKDFERRLRVYKLAAEGFVEVLDDGEWTPTDRITLRKRICKEYFWHLGYATLWESGRRREAIDMYRCALRYWPWDWRCWKTYALAKLKVRVR